MISKQDGVVFNEKAASGGLAVAAELNFSYGGIMIIPQLRKAIPANSEGGLGPSEKAITKVNDCHASYNRTCVLIYYELI